MTTLTIIITITIMIIIKLIILKIDTINNKISIFLNPCFCVAVKVSKGLSEMLHGIHHFHIDHNALVYPPIFYLTSVLDFPWDDRNTQEKLETMVMQNSRG